MTNQERIQKLYDVGQDKNSYMEPKERELLFKETLLKYFSKQELIEIAKKYSSEKPPLPGNGLDTEIRAVANLGLPYFDGYIDHKTKLNPVQPTSWMTYLLWIIGGGVSVWGVVKLIEVLRKRGA